MRKTFLLSWVIILFAFTANAQTPSNGTNNTSNNSTAFKKGDMSIMVGYGLPNLVSNFDGATGYGPFEIGYQYHLSNKVSIGLIYTYAHATGPTINYADGLGNSFSYDYDVSYSTFLVRGDYFWVNKNKTAIYSGLGLGYVSVSSSVVMVSGTNTSASIAAFSATESGLAYHLTALGIKYKAFGHLGVFAELGYGYNGALNLGLQYTIH